jgi:hypothetical protein
MAKGRVCLAYSGMIDPFNPFNTTPSKLTRTFQQAGTHYLTPTQPPSDSASCRLDTSCILRWLLGAFLTPDLQPSTLNRRYRIQESFANVDKMRGMK